MRIFLAKVGIGVKLSETRNLRVKINKNPSLL